MLLIGRIVSLRNLAAMASFPGALLRWRTNSSSFQPKRANSWATIRSALAAALSRRTSALGFSPALCSNCSSIFWRNSGLPRHHPPAQRLEFLFILVLHPAIFHPPLKFPSTGGRILPDAMLSQQAVHPHPARTMLLRREIPHQAAPRIAQQPVLRPQKMGANRIEMHIIADRLQIAAPFALHHQSLVTAAKDMPRRFMAAIQPNRVGAQQPMHAIGQIRMRGFDHQVKMIAHQTIGMHLPIGLLARLGQCLEEILPVHIVHIDVLAPIPTAHHMVDGSRKIDSQLARHSLLFSYRRPNVKN